MSRYPSVDAALDALQARTRELEHQVAVGEALEAVRARAQAPPHAEDLAVLAADVLATVRALGIPALQMGFVGDVDAADHHATVWLAAIDAGGQPRASAVDSVLAGHPVLDATAAAAAAGQELTDVMDPATFAAFLRASSARYPASYGDRLVARAPRAPAYHYLYLPVGRRPQGTLYAILDRAPTEAERDVLRRFAGLYDAAFTRAREMQQATVYAGAARLDAALERVRARALAMRTSDGFAEVVAALFDEFDALAVPDGRRLLAVVEPSREATVWTSSRDDPAPVTARMTLAGPPLASALFEAWRTGADLSYILEGAERRETDAWLAESLPGPRATGTERIYVHSVASPAGVLVAFAARPFAEDTVQVLQRLAGPFEVAHTRYRDLLHVEAQERDAARQASVDRLRAEIATMRTTADLDRVTPLVWRELTALGVPFVRCGVFIVEDDARTVHALLASPAGEPQGALALPTASDALLGEVVARWRGQTAGAVTWDAARAASWQATVIDHGGSPPPPDGALVLTLAPFAQGVLYVGSTGPLDADATAAVQDLADAFAVAYARYDDFQRLEARTHEVEATLAELRAAQAQLVESEKLASLGALTAGIAHEIKNPLNFINNFAALSRELAAELAAELADGADAEALADLIADLQSNAERIESHGRRADSIVHGMMQHARGGAGHRETVDLNALVDEHVSLAYHGRRAQMPGFSVTVERDLAPDAGTVELVPQDIGRVLINLVSNAFDAVAARATADEAGDEPTIRVATRRTADGVEVSVSDNGTGIAADVLPRLFEPFFTTKPPGAGTGLGLSLSHEIAQAHGGRLTAASTAGGATFTLALPG